MQELTFLEKPPCPRLDLEPVRPLLEYLHGLTQDSCDRDLTVQEDKVACHILLALELPDASRRVDDLVLYYAEPGNRPYRTLCVWYSIARSIAIMFQHD